MFFHLTCLKEKQIFGCNLTKTFAFLHISSERIILTQPRSKHMPESPTVHSEISSASGTYRFLPVIQKFCTSFMNISAFFEASLHRRFFFQLSSVNTVGVVFIHRPQRVSAACKPVAELWGEEDEDVCGEFFSLSSSFKLSCLSYSMTFGSPPAAQRRVLLAGQEHGQREVSLLFADWSDRAEIADLGEPAPRNLVCSWNIDDLQLTRRSYLQAENTTGSVAACGIVNDNAS